MRIIASHHFLPGRFFLIPGCVLILLSFSLLSCNNPLSKKYSAETYQEDIFVLRESKKLNEDDMDLLAKYIIISRLAGNDLQGKTYEEIINKIRAIRDFNGNKNDQQKAEQEGKRERLGYYLRVNLMEKSFGRINNKDVLSYTITFQNKSSKNIKMVTGFVSLCDLLDKEIKRVDVLMEEQLKAGATLKKLYSIPYDHSNENDKRIRSKELVDLRIEWNPDKIIFEDGRIAD